MEFRRVRGINVTKSHNFSEISRTVKAVFFKTSCSSPLIKKHIHRYKTQLCRHSRLRFKKITSAPPINGRSCVEGQRRKKNSGIWTHSGQSKRNNSANHFYDEHFNLTKTAEDRKFTIILKKKKKCNHTLKIAKRAISCCFVCCFKFGNFFKILKNPASLLYIWVVYLSPIIQGHKSLLIPSISGYRVISQSAPQYPNPSIPLRSSAFKSSISSSNEIFSEFRGVTCSTVTPAPRFTCVIELFARGSCLMVPLARFSKTRRLSSTYLFGWFIASELGKETWKGKKAWRFQRDCFRVKSARLSRNVWTVPHAKNNQIT